MRTPLGLLPLLLATACHGPQTAADLPRIYERAAQFHEPPRNPVVLVPGVLGSRLESEDGEVVWGAFRGDWADPGKPHGLRAIALPMRVGAPLSALTDDVRATGALEDLEVDLFGFAIDIGAYVDILRVLGIGGYRDASLASPIDYGEGHFTCFQFAYDWRRDIAESAVKFGAFLDETEAYVQSEWEQQGHAGEPVRFDVVAHSMGGLVLRYYLRYGATPLPEDGSLPPVTWAGAARIERAILVAPPNFGSLDSFRDLLWGRRLGSILPTYPAALLGTMPVGYELLPRPRHQVWRDLTDRDPLSAATWRDLGWGLAAPSAEPLLERLLPHVSDRAERRRIALDHQAKCLARARQLFAALDVPASPPPGTELYLVAGDARLTPEWMRVDPATGAVVETHWGPGDGVVLRSSALADERVGAAWEPHLRSPVHWSRVLFLPGEHLELTRSPAFLDNMLWWLLEEPRPGRRSPVGSDAAGEDLSRRCPVPSDRPGAGSRSAPAARAAAALPSAHAP